MVQQVQTSNSSQAFSSGVDFASQQSQGNIGKIESVDHIEAPKVDFSGANFKGIKLTSDSNRLSQADLSGADFTNASFKHLPQGLKVSGDLNLDSASALTSLPEDVALNK